MWMVKFESYTGQANAAAWFETKEAAQRVYDNAVRELNGALCEYKALGSEKMWVGVWLSVEDCFGTKFTINLANHAIAMNSTDAYGEMIWKTFRDNKDAENKYKPIYEDGTRIGISGVSTKP